MTGTAETAGKLLIVARHAFAASLRQQGFVVILLLVGGLIALNPVFSKYTLDDDNKLLIDLGVSTVLMGGIALAVFTASGVVRRELEDGTVLTLATKPVGRGVLVVGRYAGIAAALGLAVWIWALVFLLGVRHGVLQTARDRPDWPVIALGGGAAAIAFGISALVNYFAGGHFGATLAKLLAFLLAAGYGAVLLVAPDWSMQHPGTDIAPQLLAAMLLALETSWLFAAIAMACAMRLRQTPTLVITGVIVVLGLSSDHLFGRIADGSALARCAHAVIPNLQYFWIADALTQGHPVDARYLLLTGCYALLWIAAAVGIATALFQTERLR